MRFYARKLTPQEQEKIVKQYAGKEPQGMLESRLKRFPDGRPVPSKFMRTEWEKQNIWYVNICREARRIFALHLPLMLLGYIFYKEWSHETILQKQLEGELERREIVEVEISFINCCKLSSLPTQVSVNTLPLRSHQDNQKEANSKLKYAQDSVSPDLQSEIERLLPSTAADIKTAIDTKTAVEPIHGVAQPIITPQFGAARDTSSMPMSAIAAGSTSAHAAKPAEIGTIFAALAPVSGSK